MSAVPTLTYFNVPGRGEIARLCFTLGGIKYQEKTIQFSEWPSLKPTTPFGGLPLLQIGDTVVAQSAAIDHYAARLGGFLPDDPVQALLSDQVYYFVTQDIHSGLLSPTKKFDLQHKPDEGARARQEIAAGPLQDRLAQLDRIVANRPGKFIAGDKLSIGDFAIFNQLGMFKSGFWSGIPEDTYEHFKALKEYRNQVANEPRVKRFYEERTDELRVKGYRPDALET
eukprot:GHUV01027201.1.p1 GENE.GHUV01027201.1~~GHUV01027201.1.p1  ORF type:complete len:226 (+),score=44.36 GHUV01027201.1:254-931(+)